MSVDPTEKGVREREERMDARMSRLKVNRDVLPPQETFASQDELLANVKKVVEQHHLRTLLAAESLPSTIEPSYFSNLPAPLVERIQNTADICGALLAKPADQDDFPDHHARTAYSEENRTRFGSAFKERYENNRFKLGFLGVVMSNLIGVRSEIMRYAKASERLNQTSIFLSEDGQEETKAFEIVVLIERMEAFLGNLQALNDKYGQMNLKEKLVVVAEVSHVAREFLKLVTPPGSIPDEEPIPQSPI